MGNKSGKSSKKVSAGEEGEAGGEDQAPFVPETPLQRFVIAIKEGEALDTIKELYETCEGTPKEKLTTVVEVERDPFECNMSAVYALLTESPNIEVFRWMLVEEGLEGPLDGEQATCLIMTAEYDQLDMFNLLLERGADATAVDAIGENVIHKATRRSPALLAATIAACPGGINQGTRQMKEGYTSGNSWGSTPLHFAAGFDQVEAVKTLLEAGADAFAKDEKDKTPLDIAKEYDNDVASTLQEWMDERAE